MLNRFLIIRAQFQPNCFDYIIRLMYVKTSNQITCVIRLNLCSIITELRVLTESQIERKEEKERIQRERKEKKDQGNTGYWRHRRSLSVTNSLLISHSPPHLEKTCPPPRHTPTPPPQHTHSLTHMHTRSQNTAYTHAHNPSLSLLHTHAYSHKQKRRNRLECLQPTLFPMCG